MNSFLFVSKLIVPFGLFNSSQYLLLLQLWCHVCTITLVLLFLSKDQYCSCTVYFENQRFHVAVLKCHLRMTQSVALWFTIYTFTFSFGLPNVVIIYFYSRHLKKTTNKELLNRTRIHSHIPLNKVTSSAFMLFIFYFICLAQY